MWEAYVNSRTGSAIKCEQRKAVYNYLAAEADQRHLARRPIADLSQSSFAKELRISFRALENPSIAK